jgi:hypothetical protein
MVQKTAVVFGIYHTKEQAERGIDDLLTAGFSNDDISVLLPKICTAEPLPHEKNLKAPEGATAGVASGGVLGATFGLLAGIGVLAIPGIGPLIVAGPIISALAGMGAGGALGGIIGALVGIGIPEFDAKRYEGRIQEGHVLLSVHCDCTSRISRASNLLRHTGAQDISSSGQTSAEYQASGQVALNQ